MSQDQIERSGDPLERNRAVGAALSVAARKARMTDQSRIALYKTVGLRPRTSDRVFAALRVAALIVGFVLPVLAGIAYYGFVASDQYVSEVRFTVRSSSPVTKKDKTTKATGIPSAKIVQDTQIVVDNVESIAMTAWLDREVDLRSIYSRGDVDWFSRLDPDASREDLRDYWADMVDASISLPGGIVTVTVRAFDPDDAQRILEAIVARSEQLVNELSDRIWENAKASADQGLQGSAERLEAIRVAISREQNRVGVFDVEQEAESFAELIAEVQFDLLDQEARYATNLAANVSAQSPHMRVMERDIEAKRQQLGELKAKLARADATPENGKRGALRGTSLADISANAKRLEFDRELAEDQFAESAKAVERLRILSSTQLMYLDAFTPPSLAETAEYPRRILMMIAIAVAAFLVWTTLTVVIGRVQARFD